jgi:hypothetical protein
LFLTKNPEGIISTIWKVKGNQGEEWVSEKVELTLEPPYMNIFFEAEVIDWKYGDIALDDIEFQNEACQSKFSKILIILLV